MQFTDNEIATYLFCAQLHQTKTNPLTILEWNVVVKSLSEVNMQPEVLFNITPDELSNVLTQTTKAQKARILRKVDSRQKLGISMLELQKVNEQGYGVMFRSQMPNRLKKLTQRYLPAFFYYAGDVSILLHRSLGVVGARNANQEELAQTAAITKAAASHGIIIISGGARGVDSTAVESTLENGGKAVVFPADGLENWIKKSSIRNYIANGQLLLMSTQRLHAHFTGAYAMQRNKFIHAPSNAVLVASSTVSSHKKSGTWEGVLENLTYKWSPIYVIGSSEGVEKLKADEHAKPFSTFDEIYQDDLVYLKSDSLNLDKKLESTIQLSIEKGLDQATIEKKFLEISARLYHDKKIESQKLAVNEQLSLEDYM